VLGVGVTVDALGVLVEALESPAEVESVPDGG
jgi:hypothetical protein